MATRGGAKKGSRRRSQATVASTPGAPTPPTCFREPGRTSVMHGDSRELPYQWLRKKHNPKVREYVAAETKYAHTLIPDRIVDALYKEQRARIKDADVSVPFKHKGFYHYVREVEGLDYEVHCRKPVQADPKFVEKYLERLRDDPETASIEPDEDEEVLLDLNEERKLRGAASIELGDMDVNPSQQLLAYVVCLTTGEERYTLFVKDLVSGTTIRKLAKIRNAGRPGPHIAWATDTVLYVSVSTDKGRSIGVARVDLGDFYVPPPPTPTPTPTPSPSPGRTPVAMNRDDADGLHPTGGALASSAAATVSTAVPPHTTVSDARTGVTVVYREADSTFTVEMLSRTADDGHLAFCCMSPNTTEWHFARADADSDWQVFWPRRRGVQYNVFPHPSGLWLVTHDIGDSVNRQLDACFVGPGGITPMTLPGEEDGAPTLRPLVRYDPTVSVEDIDVYNDFVVVTVLRDAFPHLLVVTATMIADVVSGDGSLQYSDLIDLNDVIRHHVRGGSSVASDGGDLGGLELTGESDGFDDLAFRVRAESMREPGRHFQLRVVSVGDARDVSRGWRAELLHSGTMRGPHRPADYRAKLLWAPAPPGVARDAKVLEASAAASPTADVRVPISVVYRVDKFELGRNPLLLDAYGSYGDAEVTTFHPDHKSLLDRGVVMAFAMVRGGGQLGPAWHHAGRLERRVNSITDFVACAEYLVAEQWCDPDRLSATGGSAGATVVAAAMLRVPSLFKSVVLAVPFVDCLSTMLDPSLPLTMEEWDEWGNPVADRDAYFAIKAYSPVDNVPSPEEAAGSGTVFPHVLLDSSWHDTRVGIHEPATLGAALRATWGPSGEAGRVLLHHCTFKADHGGEASRYDAARNSARVDVFVLGTLGIVDDESA